MNKDASLPELFEREEEGISFNSIAEMHDALVRKRTVLSNTAYPKEVYAYFQEYHKDILGSETDYHNLSVEFSKQHFELFAVGVANIGVSHYPLSADLWADVIKYAQETGQLETSLKGIEQLTQISKQYWTWRTFVFAIDFLKDGLAQCRDIEEHEKNLKKAQNLIDEFKRYIPHDERAYLAEAELYLHKSEHGKAITALLQGIESCKVAPACCLKISDIYMEYGEYAAVEKYARIGILAALQDQPTVSVGYLYFLLAMAMDAQRIQARQSDAPLDEKQIQKIITAYQTADDLFVNEGRLTVSYRKNIRARLIIIEKEENTKIPELHKDEDSTVAALLKKGANVLSSRKENEKTLSLLDILKSSTDD